MKIILNIQPLSHKGQLVTLLALSTSIYFGEKMCPVV